MNSPIHPKLTQAFQSAQSLPESTQEALAQEIVTRVGELATSQLSDAQRDEIQARLQAPARYADPAMVKAFFARHGVQQ